MKTVHTLYVVACSVLLACCAGPRAALLEISDRYDISPVANSNTDADELAPCAIPSGLYFASNKEVGDEEEHRLYFLPNNASSFSEIIPVRVEGGAARSGAMVIAGDVVYFGQCYRSDGHGDCDVLTGSLGGDDGISISNVRSLPLPLNDIEWDHHPAVSPDGKLFVFASERLRGLGASDLYMSTLGTDGWSAPVLMSEKINTSHNEMTPSFSADGRTLYFASDGRSGFGGFDLYASELVKDAWTQPKLLPAPFNSEDDDLFLFGGPGEDISYVASDREGGEGGFDLYRIKKIAPPPPPPPPPEKRPLILRVVAENSFTKERIPAAIVISDAADDRQIGEGRGTAEAPIEGLSNCSITASHPGFMSAFVDVTLDSRGGEYSGAVREGPRDVVQRVISLTPVSEEERKIYAFTVEFDFDLFNIRPEEQRKLDSAAVLLELYPNSTVVISGHTDSLGTDSYNIKLGYNRATEVSRYVATYLRGKHVNLRNPMEIRTYGETMHIATNTTEEGRQRNRRVEIAIIRNT